MDQLFAFYTDRLWIAALFLGAALPLALLFARRREGGASVLLGIGAFALWEVLLLAALLDADAPIWTGASLGVLRDVVLATALFVVPIGLIVTLLIVGDTRLICPACALMGLGALLVPAGELGLWVLTALLLGLLVLLFRLLSNATWSASAGYAVGAAILTAIGGLTAAPAGGVLAHLWTSVATLFTSDYVLIAKENLGWLALLLLIPLIVVFSFRSLAGLGPIRRCLAIGLRCLLVVCLTLALAEFRVPRSNEAVTVLFLYDRSLSLPKELDDNPRPDERKDLREQRLVQFINDAVAKRGPVRQRDSAGLILFGRWPRLELPPANVGRFNYHKLPTDIDNTYTDIASALKLALASFPEGTGKRIVLISDGNENVGSAEEQARIARQNGVEIDIVPVVGGRHNQNEVLIERLDAPALTEQDSRLPLRILIRSYHPDVVIARLVLMKKIPNIGNDGGYEPILEKQVELTHGLNPFYFEQPGAKAEACTYRAKLEPLRVVVKAKGADGKWAYKLKHEGLPGDRNENNDVEVSVITRGQRTVLLIEPNVGDHQFLVDRLQQAKRSLRVLSIQPSQLDALDQTDLVQFLARFDSIILANLPAESLTEMQQKALRSNVQEQGCGLVMIGGPQSYGAGGWQGTEVEKALPVTCDLKSMEVEGKSGLVLIMHATEMEAGNMWQKKVAQTAVEKLSPVDMVGVTYFAHDGQGGNNGHTWHVPFKQIGGNRAQILKLLDTMNPGDMPDADPSLKMAYGALNDPKYGLNKKLVIFISDGDHWSPPVATLTTLRKAGIPVSTVCITTHGQGEYKRMDDVARMTGGRAYPKRNANGTYTPLSPKDLPAIYMKETRLISQSFIHAQPFVPDLVERAGPTEGLPDQLPPLHGFVRTTRRPGPLVHVPIEKVEKRESFPVLAYWHYGLGKVVAYTSDARTVPPEKKGWDVEWASTGMHAKFWEQVVDWSLRAVDSGKNLSVTTEARDGKVRVTITARDEKQRPLTDLELRAGVTTPKLQAGEGGQPGLKFVQKGVGVYEAELRAEDVGTYFINVQAIRKKEVVGKNGKPEQVEEIVDAVRTGVAVPYSPEFAEMESNPALLERLRDLTGGKSYPDQADALAKAVTNGDVFRPTAVRSRTPQPIWFWLVLLTGVGLFFDVAVRRLSIDPLKLSRGAQEVWAHLLGTARTERQGDFLEKLQSR
ncbi:MAG TPA: VWA domain-containing protein, partial [Gemmataceae bacterium]|nr:VWA domain-containing protein [Gemmataceae bacterium]